MSAAEHEDDHADLIEALGQAGQAFAAEPERMINAGAARGRQLRRRRAAAITGGVTALALAGVGGLIVGTPGSPHQSVAAASGSSTGPVTVTATKPAAPTASASGPTGDQVLALLRSGLPAGQVTKAQGHGRSSDGRPMPPSAELVYDDGSGPSFLRISLNRLDPQAAAGYLVCPDPAYVQVDHCTTVKQADGSTLTVVQGYEFPDRRKPTKLWEAYRYTPEQGLIELAEANSPTEKDDPVSRPNPPLGPDQLAAIVNDPGWAPLLAQLPAPQPVVPRNHRMLTGDEIITDLLPLLPPGLTVSAKVGGPGDGFAHLTVDDGHGKSLVEVNADDWSKNPVGSQFDSATVLPDGTKVLLDPNADSGGKGGRNIVRRTAEALRPDGTRIAVAVTNSTSAAVDATRPEPALTMDQLQAIASSPTWQLHDAATSTP
jgi:hypothetical protein